MTVEERCPHCGFAPSQLETLQHELSLCEKDLRGKRSQISAMKSDRNQQRELSPFADQAREVFDYWREKLAPRAREFSTDRFDKVVARLNGGATVAELKQAVDGCMADEWSMARAPAATDLRVICKSEAHVAKFRNYVDEGMVAFPGPSEEQLLSDIRERNLLRERCEQAVNLARRTEQNYDRLVAVAAIFTPPDLLELVQEYEAQVVHD